MEEITLLKEQLKQVRTAIAAIETGAQSYKIGNRSLSRPDLATLYARETRLKAEIARAETGDVFFANLDRL